MVPLAVSPAVFRELVPISRSTPEPDGRNIKFCNAGFDVPEGYLQAVAVVEVGCDFLGVALRWRRDCCSAVDHEGNLIDGDKIMGAAGS